MIDRIDYQPSLPQGSNLRIFESEDAIHISRVDVSRFALWREAVLPPVAIIIFLAIWCLEMFWVRQFGAPPIISRALYVIFSAVAAFFLARSIRSSWQNAGIVTEISIVDGQLYWQKRMLWGSKKYIWPLETIRDVQIEPLASMLKIRRTRGAPLGAFAYHSMTDLQSARAGLTRLIELHRAALAQNRPQS